MEALRSRLMLARDPRDQWRRRASWSCDSLIAWNKRRTSGTLSSIHSPATPLFFPEREPVPASPRGQHTLYALTFERQLGVDVEYMKDGVEYDELATVSFSPNERSVLHSLPKEAKREAFFSCWTRKEAYIKARGLGLSLSLELFDVSMRPDELVALLASREDPCEVNRWTLQNLYPGTGYAAALAVEGTGWQLNCWQWL